MVSTIQRKIDIFSRLSRINTRLITTKGSPKACSRVLFCFLSVGFQVFKNSFFCYIKFFFFGFHPPNLKKNKSNKNQVKLFFSRSLKIHQSTTPSCGNFKFFTISTFKQIVEIIWLDQIVTISQSLRFLRWLKCLRLQNLKIFGMETILKIRKLSQFCHLHNLFEPWNCEEFKIATTRCCALISCKICSYAY